GEGASYSWKSDKMGDGGMKTIKVIPNKEIDQTISFNTPMGDSESEVYWRFKGTETPGQTQVTWGMKGERSLVEKVFMSFQKEDFEMQLRVMYAKGLDNLKATVENEIKKYSVNVDGVSQHGGGFYMYVTAASRMDGIATKMGGMFGQVSGYMAQNNIDATGMPFTIYNTIDAANNTVIFSTAIPVRERVIIPEGSPVVCGFMEPPVAVKVTLKGNYNNLDKAYAAGMQYVAENNLEVGPTAKMFEVYRNDPGEVPNPAHWLTEVYIPIIPNTPTQQ
ncbi:MAG: AraC family transcriptional regulator, partial [Marinirhabdus sp.]